MKLLILSDTHGNYPMAIRALEKAGRVDQIVHLGDDIEDARIIETIIGHQVIKVPGNCDPVAAEYREFSMSIEGVNIFITHGDSYNVRKDLTKLYKKAVEKSAQLVMYGHTHIAAIEKIGDILFVNPGCLSYNCQHISYAILTLAGGKVEAEVMPVTWVDGDSKRGTVIE